MGLEKLNQKYPKKRAFITGAGSGLGACFARLLAQEGWTLHLADINNQGMEDLKQELSAAKEVHLHTLNVKDKAGYDKIKDEVVTKSEGIDLLINNAGIGDGDFIHQYEVDEWEKMVDINLLGVFYGCHLFIPGMIDQSNGLIINIGSAAGFMNAPGMTAYNATKAAVYSLSETLLHELKPHNIHVSVATPTFFKTNIMSQATGSSKFVSFAEKQMAYSKTNAEEMATVILTKASKGKFQIIHPYDARRNHFLKKWFPGLVSKIFVKMMQKFSR